VKDGVIQDDLPGKCVQGNCVYDGQCGSATTGGTFCEKPESNLCLVDFFDDPVVEYENADDKTRDEFTWICNGFDPDSDIDDAECSVDRDCQVVPGNWVEE
jgi:hypothetical protein